MIEQILKVIQDGNFEWHKDADRLNEEADFSNQPAMKHILMALRKQNLWVGLTEDQKLTANWSNGSFGSGALWAEKQLKENNK